MIYLFYNWKFVSLKLITHFTHPPSSSATTILLSASVISALFCSALLSCVQIPHVSGVIWHLPFFDISFSMTPFVWVCARSLQSCLTLCDSMDYSPPGSSVHGILQTRMLEWVAVSFSKGSSWPRDWTHGLLHWRADFLLLSHQGSPQHGLPC